MKFIKFNMVNLDYCPRCGEPYDGSYCPCMENDEPYDN